MAPQLSLGKERWIAAQARQAKTKADALFSQRGPDRIKRVRKEEPTEMTRLSGTLEPMTAWDSDENGGGPERFDNPFAVSGFKSYPSRRDEKYDLVNGLKVNPFTSNYDKTGVKWTFEEFHRVTGCYDNSAPRGTPLRPIKPIPKRKPSVIIKRTRSDQIQEVMGGLLDSDGAHIAKRPTMTPAQVSSAKWELDLKRHLWNQDFQEKLAKENLKKKKWAERDEDRDVEMMEADDEDDEGPCDMGDIVPMFPIYQPTAPRAAAAAPVAAVAATQVKLLKSSAPAVTRRDIAQADAIQARIDAIVENARKKDAVVAPVPNKHPQLVPPILASLLDVSLS